MEQEEILNTVPAEIVAGMSYEWEMTLVHPPADGFTAKMKIAGASTILTITATPTDDDASYSFRIAPADTTAWPTGEYFYQIWTEDGTDKWPEVEARLLVNSLISAAGHDARSVAKKIVDAIDALVLGRATSDQQSYVIGNRELVRLKFEELTPVRRYYAAIVDAEVREARRKAGKSLWPSIKLKFN
jgi:predicted metalloendopeptidase